MSTTPEQKIIVIYDDKRPEYKSADKIIGKRAREIKIALNVPKGYTLAIRTPTFIRYIGPDVVISDICKDLVRENRFDYSYALQIISKEEKNSIQFIFRCEVDSISPDSNTPIQMPNFIVNFNNDEFNLKGEYVLDKIVNSFQLPIEDPQLYINKELVDFSGQSALDIINKLRFDKNDNVFKCHLTDLALKMMNNRVNPMRELVQTEGAFLERLNFLINFFYPRIQDASIVKDKSQYDRFDQCCRKIFNFHTKFLTSLSSSKIEYRTLISNCFFEMGDGFLINQDFIRQYGNFQSIITEILSNDKLRAIEQKVYSNDKISFDQYTSAPFQRPLKYPLLLKQIRESTPSSHVDYRFLCIAESQMKSICSKIDTYCDHIKNIPEKMKIYNRIQDPDISLASAERSLKSSYEVKVRTKDNWMKKKPGMIYLYNDRVLCTKKNKSIVVKVTETVLFYNKIKNLQFIISADQEDDSIFFIVDIQKCIGVAFETKEKRDDFIENFRQIRQNLMILKPNQIFAEEVVMKGPVKCPLPHMCHHSAVAMNDNTLILAGGFIEGDEDKNSPMVKFDSNPDTFSVNSQIFTPAPEMKMTSAHPDLNEKEFVSLYLFGGKKNRAVMLYMNNGWEELPGKATFTRVKHTFVSYKNSLIVFGGLDENNQESNELWIYDLIKHSWTKPFPKHKIPPPRFDHSAVIYKNAMIIHGGQLNGEKLNDTWIFSFDQNEWAQIKLQKNNAIVPRAGHEAVIANQFMIVFGGEGFLNHPFALNIDTLNVVDLKFKGNYIYGMNHMAAATVVDTQNLNEKQIICFGGFTNDRLAIINMFTRFYLPEIITNPDQIQSSKNINLEMNESHVKLLKYKSKSSVMLFSNSSELFVPPIDEDCFK